MTTEELDVCQLLDHVKQVYYSKVTALECQLLALQAESTSNVASNGIRLAYETKPKRKFPVEVDFSTYNTCNGEAGLKITPKEAPASISPKHAFEPPDEKLESRRIHVGARRGLEEGREPMNGSFVENGIHAHGDAVMPKKTDESVVTFPGVRRGSEEISEATARSATEERIHRRLTAWQRQTLQNEVLEAELKTLRQRESKMEELTMMRRLVTSKWFESFFNIIIVLNCAAMGVEAHGHAGKPYKGHVLSFLEWCDQAFTFLFTIELVMRVQAFGLKSLYPWKPENRWNFMDALLVFSGIIISWLLPLVAVLFRADTRGGALRILTVFRVCRLARLFKVVSRVPVFREAWMLIRGLTDSLRTLFWTCVVICFVTYIFGIFGCSLISNELFLIYTEATDPDTSRYYTERDIFMLERLLSHMQGLDRVMYSLIQVLTLDSFHSFITPLQELRGLGWSWMYWYSYIAVAVFVLMNLVTAIIVENAVEHAQKDEKALMEQKQKETKREINELQKLFILMDVDGSGSLSWDEFKGSFQDELIAAKWRLLGFREYECAELFCLLDDGDHEIQTNEFFEGLQKMRGPAMAKDVFRLQKDVNTLRDIVRNQLKSKYKTDRVTEPKPTLSDLVTDRKSILLEGKSRESISQLGKVVESDQETQV